LNWGALEFKPLLPWLRINRVAGQSVLPNGRGALQYGSSGVARDIIRPLGCVPSGKVEVMFPPLTM
jgi:hypothetical protein